MKLEQLYMKLDDHTIRPRYNTNGVNTNSVHYVRFKSQFVDWLDEDTMTVKLSNEIDEILFDLLDRSLYSDGYQLTKHLEDSNFIFEGDSSLVELLDDCTFVRRALEDEKVKQWVKECFLELSTDLLKKYICYETLRGFGKRETNRGYITKLLPELYQVVVSKTNADVGGYIVNAEDIQIIY